jgi:hypothetical protein
MVIRCRCRYTKRLDPTEPDAQQTVEAINFFIRFGNLFRYRNGYSIVGNADTVKITEQTGPTRSIDISSIGAHVFRTNLPMSQMV